MQRINVSSAPLVPDSDSVLYCHCCWAGRSHGKSARNMLECFFVFLYDKYDPGDASSGEDDSGYHELRHSGLLLHRGIPCR